MYRLFLTLSAIILALAPQLPSISAHPDPTSSGSLFQKRQPHPILQARQAPAPKGDKPGGSPRGDNDGKGGKPEGSPAENAAGQLIGMLLQTSEALDAVTHMGSNATIVKLGSEALIKMLPELHLARQKVMKEANKNGGDEEFHRSLVASTESMVKVLQGISAKPEDCNAIKANFPGLVEPFNLVIAAAEGTINLALPAQAAELEKEKLKGKGGKKEEPKGPAPK
ncbi:hypothetical protein PTTG_28663 [Puccinia triticina 1-1 BBBD Race 1]|uniref:Cell wall protein n=2 Tax=Puccinia triticina TaxID=208348 RepID=A0A0C4ETG9_PUCT1|nr:uncharacterized protein PtA15_3A850 [Puccinia triticina]OAV89551.1 hypothetical protein PTTG_28663 [Puccinia triticina 1-1 BBBD Race 1]WAQ83479.1 hypothetical protein PtA15_3A850 [Puccinia triticina]WAR54317.1 hypothetical protein PtB15_3B831 [Puccinia triticina]